MHELIFVKLEPGKTVQMVAWLEKPEGPSAGSLVNSAAPMTVGVVNVTTVDLSAEVTDSSASCPIPRMASRTSRMG